MRASTRIILPALALLTLSDCKQSEMDCTSAHGEFAARFDLKKGAEDSPCGGLTGDLLGMQTYFAEGGINGTPKFAESTVAIRAQFMFAYAYERLLADLLADGMDPFFTDYKALEEMIGDPDALGDFKVGVDAEGFCEVPKISTVELNLPEIPEIPETPPTDDDPATPDVDESSPGDPGAPGQAATSLKYVWDNVKFLVTPDAQGTQFSADLKLTVDGETCDYHVVAVYPPVPCINDEGEADQSICDDDANGINPDFPTKCSKTFGFCLLEGELPAYE